MIPKLICWLIGHKIWVKAYSGTPTGNTNPISGQKGYFYLYGRQPFCHRCGHDLTS